MTTPRGSPELAASQAVPETTVNEQIRRTEAGACHFPVTDRVTAPPGSCTDGANYLIIATATGAFASKETQIATAVGTNAASGWYYHSPIEGFTAYVMDENARYLFDGSAWSIDTTGGSYTDENAQDAVGGMVDSTLVYVDGTPVLKRAPITGHVTIADGSNAAALGSFTKAQLDAAVSDGNVLYVGDAYSTSATDAAIAAAVAGLSWKQAVRVATTANGTLASAFENGDTVDGVTLATGDRILIKNQSSGSENGIYVVAASGAPARASDADSGAELVNASVYVSEGTTNTDTQWTCTTNAPITIGSTSLAFAQLASGGGGFTAASTTEALTGTDTSKGVTPDALAALWEQGSDVASSGTISLGEGGYFNITGTTTITDIDFATDKAGRHAWVKFAGVLTLTHNSSTLILPTGANITTAAGDTACFVSEGSDVVRCVAYQRASGAALAGSSARWDFSPPSAAGFTLASGDATNMTISDDSDIGLIVASGTPVTGDLTRWAYKTLSTPSGNWVMTMKFKAFVPAANYLSFGLIIQDTASGATRLSRFGVTQTARNNFSVEYYASLTAYGAASPGNVTYSSSQEINWIRIEKSGSSLIYSVSVNGKTWYVQKTTTLTEYLVAAPSRVGIGFSHNKAGGDPIFGNVEYFSLTGTAV